MCSSEASAPSASALDRALAESPALLGLPEAAAGLAAAAARVVEAAGDTFVFRFLINRMMVSTLIELYPVLSDKCCLPNHGLTTD